MSTGNRLLLATLVAAVAWRARHRLRPVIAGGRRALANLNLVAEGSGLERQEGVPALSFAPLTPLYDVLTGAFGYGTSFTAKVLDAAAMEDGETLLDVGAGTGSLLLLAKQRYPRSQVIGIEPDPRMLQRAQAKIEQAKLAVELVGSSAEALPFPSASVDLAVSSLVFHHLPTAEKGLALAEIHRVLKLDGRLLLADFGPPDTIWLRVFFALVQALRVPEAHTLRDNIDGNLLVLMQTAGFRVREVAPRYRGIRFFLATSADTAVHQAAHRRDNMRRVSRVRTYRRSSRRLEGRRACPPDDRGDGSVHGSAAASPPRGRASIRSQGQGGVDCEFLGSKAEEVAHRAAGTVRINTNQITRDLDDIPDRVVTYPS
jgi:FkbM family methyltransferase